MARISIDNSNEIFGSKTSIADLAQFSFAGRSSDDLIIYEAEYIMLTEWRDEVAAIEYEYGQGMSVRFRDGSVFHVSALKLDDSAGYVNGIDEHYARKANGLFFARLDNQSVAVH